MAYWLRAAAELAAELVVVEHAVDGEAVALQISHGILVVAY